MNPKPSDSLSLSKSLLIVGCAAGPLAAFTFQATPLLLVTVAQPILSWFTWLLLLLILLSATAIAIIGIEWYWTRFNDDRYWRLQRREGYERHKKNVKARRQAIISRHKNRSTDSAIPVPPQQLRAQLRRSDTNAHRP